MIRSIFFACIFLLVPLFTLAQTQAESTSLDPQIIKGIDVTQERKKLEQQKMHTNDLFKNETKICYSKFAVNDCKATAKQKNITTLNEIRRQEIILKDIERKKKAGDAIDRYEEKMSFEKALENEKNRQKLLDAQYEREQNLKKKQEDAEKKKQDESSNIQNKNAQIKSVQDKEANQDQKINNAGSERSKYEKKLLDAQEHKKSVLDRNASRRDTPSDPLPIPGQPTKSP